MEVTPEIFAWLTSLNIINPFVSFSQDLVNDFKVPEKTVSLLMGGKYLDIMIQPLQDVYNKFYKINDDYISNLMKLKQIPDGQEYISNSLKYTNWKIIFEVLSHFGLVFTEDDLSLLVNNNKDQLKKIISKIYNTYTKYLNGINNDDDLINKYNINSQVKEQIAINNQKQKQIENEQNNLLNINEINPLKNYDECNTLLEFMILSLCKNMNMKPRAAVTLLYKNRKYLKKICISGYNNEFQAIKNWLSDLYNNNEIMTKLISNTEEGLNICFSSIGSALYCRDLDISLQSAQLLNIMKYKVGMNWDWFYNEGINVFFFIINKEDNYRRKEFLDLLYDFFKDNITLFFDEVKKKFNSDNYSTKKTIYDFISYIINLANNMDQDFQYYFLNFIYDICLNKNNIDMSYNLSILSEVFFSFSPIEENTAIKIISYFKDSIRCNVHNIYATGIYQIFLLIEKFGTIKNKYAPHLYKNMTYIFLEEYDNEIKREIFLENFEKFFNENKDIPIDILMEPYLNKINGCENYGMTDFLFLLKIVEHPRIKSKEISDIIQFILNVCLNNIPYTRCANLILNLIFGKELINKFINEEEDININININKELSFFEEIQNKFIDFINTALDMYISNITKQEDKFILETPYDIMTQNFENVNIQVKETIVNCVKQYRKIKGFHSSGLLSLMWYYSDNDDIMMQIEELNRPIYEPMQVYYERMRLEQIERDKHDYTKKAMLNLYKLREKRMNIILSKQALDEQKKFKDDRMRKKMLERRRIVRLMSGIEARIRPQILTGKKMSKSNSDFYEQFYQNNLLYRTNKLETGQMKSNMLFAVNNAANNYVNKGVISQKSRFFQKLNAETTFHNNINGINTNTSLPRSKSELNMFENKSQEELMKQYGRLMNSEKMKKYIQEEYYVKSNKREKLLDLLIQKEGSLISHNMYNKRYLLPRNLFVECLGIPFDLEEEENRELKAIKGYNKEYLRNIKYYFKFYSNEAKQKITKSRFVKLLRDIGIDKEKIGYDEISALIRLMFQDNFSEFDFNQFINLLVQSSYIIYTKRRPCLTIGETYSILLKKFKLKKNNQERISTLKYKYQPVIDYLLQLKEDKQQFNIPEGFKFAKNTYVKYNCRLAPHMEKYLGESKFICYQVLEEIIYNACKSSIIEPYVEISTEDIVEIEPEKVHNWSPGLTMAYIDLDKNLKFFGLFAADALEKGIKKILKKNYYLNEEGKMIRLAKGISNIKWVKQDLEKKKEYRLKQIAELERKKTNGEIEKNKYKCLITKEEYEQVEKNFKKVKKKIKDKENEKKERIKQKEKIELENKEKNNVKLIPFFKTKKKKLKEEFKSINKKQNELKKEREQEEKKEIEKYKRKEYFVSEKDKNYNEFEKNINNSMKKLSEKNEIKECLNNYINHFKVIYDIYSKIGYNKISFNSKEVIHIDEFKQFLLNFAILGIYINSEQMSWIFKNIAKVSQQQRYNEMYFDFDDFKLSICYLTIFSKYENKTWKIMPKDIEQTNYNTIEHFCQNIMGLKLPFDKVQLEKFINERRSMPMKNLLNLQHTKKLEEAKNYINNNSIKKTDENKKHNTKGSKDEKNSKKESKKGKHENKSNNSNNKSEVKSNNKSSNNNNKNEIKEDEEEENENEEE